MKSKMMALDVRASVEEIKSLVGHRLQNVYDIGPKFLLLKFGLGDQKTTVLIENGVRMHITKLNREKPRMPSQFTFKLRKHIKKWRLDHVRQQSGDRSVILRFGTEETFFLLVVELYGHGNVLLLDHDNVIMMMLRTQKEKDVTLSVKGTYPLEAEREQRTSAMFLQAADDHFQKLDPATSLNKALTSFDNLGPQLADHVLAMAGLASNSKVSQFSVPPSSDASPLRVPLLHAFALLEGDAFQPGGVLVSDVTTSSAAAAGAPEQPAGPPRYSDFAPLVLKHLESKKIELRDSFGEICDQYFLRSEMEKIEQHNDKKEIATVSSKERFLREHNRRLEKLQSEEELNIKRGSMLEANADSVQEVIDLMNMLLAMKLGWDKIRLLVKARQREGHPVAYMIHDVHLDRNSVTVLLEDELEEGEDDQDIEPFAVEVDLSLNAQRNASNYYTVKKKVHQKLEKTIAATDKATVSAEKKGQRVSAKQGAMKKEVVEQRKTFWYEKFFWFLTTFGDLAVYARDQTQTDTLLRKYMVPTDIFIHCDAARAPVCVLKAASLDKRIAVESILEAGSMCVSRSAAWDSKTSMSAWWVSASTVSPTQVGSYSVSGERNYLKPMPLATAVVAVFRTKSERPWVPLDPEIPVVCSASLVVESSKEPHTPQAALVQAANSSLELLAAQEAIEPPQGDELDGRQEELEAPAAAIRRTGISIRSLTQRNAPKDDDGRSSTSTALDENGAISRRTQHKLKKMKKYAEQDDDEREERMRLLGNRPSRIHKLHSESPTQEPESRPQIVAASEPKASSSKATERPPRIAVDPEKYSTQIAEGDSELKYFNPKPDAEDEAMYAVCLCVPLGVAIQYKHRANITYGQEKKGNAASAIVRHFSSGTEAHASFSTALRFVEAEQLTNQLPSNIKVHFAQQPATGGRGKSQHADPTTSSKASR